MLLPLPSTLVTAKCMSKALDVTCLLPFTLCLSSLRAGGGPTSCRLCEPWLIQKPHCPATKCLRFAPVWPLQLPTAQCKEAGLRAAAAALPSCPWPLWFVTHQVFIVFNSHSCPEKALVSVLQARSLRHGGEWRLFCSVHFSETRLSSPG